MRTKREREPQPQPKPIPNASANGEDDDDNKNNNYYGSRRRRLIMDKFKASIISHLSVVDSSSVVVERRLEEVFRGHDFHTPTHPPYALMIRTAIISSDEGCSTEEAISEFIEGQYRDLPWAHSRVLGVHLRRLCEDGEILRGEDGRYLLMREDVDTKQQQSRTQESHEIDHVKGRTGKGEKVKGIEREIGIVQEQSLCKSNEELEEGFPKPMPVTGIVIELPVGHLDDGAARSSGNQIPKHGPPPVSRYGKVYRRRKP